MHSSKPLIRRLIVSPGRPPNFVTVHAAPGSTQPKTVEAERRSQGGAGEVGGPADLLQEKHKEGREARGSTISTILRNFSINRVTDPRSVVNIHGERRVEHNRVG